MKKTAFSLAAMAVLAAAGSAHAQSNVTLYGRLDAGISNTSNAGPNKSSMTQVSSGGMNTSRWGILGSEDLGGGLKAVFNLEGGILVDTGAADGALFKRQANVGLEGAFPLWAVSTVRCASRRAFASQCDSSRWSSTNNMRMVSAIR